MLPSDGGLSTTLAASQRFRRGLWRSVGAQEALMGELIRKRNAKGNFIGWYVRFYENRGAQTRATKTRRRRKPNGSPQRLKRGSGRSKLGINDPCTVPKNVSRAQILRRYLAEYGRRRATVSAGHQQALRLSAVLPLLGKGNWAPGCQTRSCASCRRRTNPRSVLKISTLNFPAFGWSNPAGDWRRRIRLPV